MTKIRTQHEINVIKKCGKHIWKSYEINYEYGFKNCCQCQKCGVSCGENLNANYLAE